MSHSHKTLLEIHEDVPAEHYDVGIKKNLFQKYWHSRRFTEISRVIKPVSGPVLDVGCHSGTFTSVILSKIGSQDIYGVDISPEAIKLAKKRIPSGHFEVADAAKLPFKSDFFDAVFCLEVLEHVDDPVASLKEIYRVMKKGSYAVILVPSDNKLFKIVWFIWTLYYPVWRHAHVQSYSNGSLEKTIQGLDFKIKTIKDFNLGMLKMIIFEK